MTVQNSVNNILYGTSTNDDALSGQIGEYITSSVLIGSSIPLSSGIASNVTSIILTPGDWKLSGSVIFNPSSLTTSSSIKSGISIVSATFPTLGSENNTCMLNISFPAGQSSILNIGEMRLSISSNTTVYLIAQSSFLLGTMSAYGFIGARRAR